MCVGRNINLVIFTRSFTTRNVNECVFAEKKRGNIEIQLS